MEKRDMVAYVKDKPGSEPLKIRSGLATGLVSLVQR
jgi:hypothetical protein